MNIQVHKPDHAESGPLQAAIPLLVVISILLATPALAVDRYQQKMLFTPSDSTLRAEAKGRVMIYDGLDIDTVEKAMSEQYDRIDNMMFVRIQHPQDDGDYYVEDDGCD